MPQGRKEEMGAPGILLPGGSLGVGVAGSWGPAPGLPQPQQSPSLNPAQTVQSCCTSVDRPRPLIRGLRIY